MGEKRVRPDYDFRTVRARARFGFASVDKESEGRSEESVGLCGRVSATATEFSGGVGVPRSERASGLLATRTGDGFGQGARNDEENRRPEHFSRVGKANRGLERIVRYAARYFHR